MAKQNKELKLPKANIKILYICYQCAKKVVYLFSDGRCKDCTRLTPEEVRGG